jgi:lysyl-tRNA synthetase class 2
MLKIQQNGVYKDIFSPPQFERGQCFCAGGRVISEQLLDKYSYFFINTSIIFIKTRWDNSKGKVALRRGDLVELNGVIQKQASGDFYLDIESVCIIKQSHGFLPNQSFFNSEQPDSTIQAMFDPICYEFHKKQSLLLHEIRNYLYSLGFIEVITPTLIRKTYSSKAREFITSFAARKQQLFLKKIHEPRLKMYLMAGYDRVYEIGKVFRNEGKSAQFLPEFTNLDVLFSYVTYQDVVEIAQNLFTLSASVFGVSISSIPQRSISEFNIPGSLEDQARIFKKEIAPKIIDPVIIDGYPASLSPQAKPSKNDSQVSQEFKLFYRGASFVHGYIFNDDLTTIREGISNQVNQRPDLEGKVWTGFEDSLIYGMPPTGGVGIGLEKMVQHICKKDNIKQVLFFRR